MACPRRKLSPELEFIQLQKPETCHLKRKCLQKGLWNNITKQAVAPLRDTCSYFSFFENGAFQNMFSRKLR